jgi:hypothetical protein
VIDLTGPQRVLEDPEPVATGRRARHGDRPDEVPAEPKPGRRAAARRVQDAEADDDAAREPRSRRRVGWRKGTDVDEEMWPVEAFGGVSDEQFWDDMASDKPLATTARTAQPETVAKRRPPNAGPLPDLYPRDGRARGDGAGTNPQPRLAPDDRTAIQPAVPPVQAGLPSSATGPVATQPYPAAMQPSPNATQPTRAATQPARAATQPTRAATQPARAAQQPAESRGRSHAAISPDEDPLTSPAYSLRRKGSVDGRSYPSSGAGYSDSVPAYRPSDRPSHSTNGGGRSDPLRSDGYRTDPQRPGGGYGSTAPYPQQPYGEPSPSMNTPPYGETYGYGNPAGPPGQGDPRRASGGWSAAPNGADDGGRGSRPAYPPVNGHRGYDPRGYDRRLSITS